MLKNIGETAIILADDVVFTGSVLKTLIEKFKNNGIKVIGIRACISSYESYNYFNKTLPLKLKCGILMSPNLIDQICERDFYFGIVGSGISVKKGTSIYKSPYFTPFGDPITRASIPKEFESAFSTSCIKRSITLWQEIERLNKRKILVNELPEAIINTENEEIIKVLKKGLK